MEPGCGDICIMDGAVSLTAYPGLNVFLVTCICKAVSDINRGRQEHVGFQKARVKMIHL